MFDDILDFLKFIFPFVLFVVVFMVVVFGVLTGLDIVYNQNYCKTMQSIHSGFEFRWELWGGCLVKTPSGYWINAKEYNYLEGDVR